MNKYYRLIGVIILAVILTKVDFHKIIVQISQLNFLTFILINLLIFPGLVIKAYRWKYILYLQGIDYPFRDAFLSYLGGIYAGIVTPGRIGESVRAVYLKQEKNISFSEGLASLFIDRLLDLYLLILLGSIGFLHFLNIRNTQDGIFVFLLALFLLSVPFLLVNRHLLEKIVKRIYKLMISGLDNKFFDGQFKIFFASVKKIITQRIYLAFILTIAVYLFYFLQCYLLARLVSINISYVAIVSFVAISSLASLLPITVLGIGTREVSLVYLFSLAGIKAESALAYSFLLFISFYMLSGFLAFFGWYVKGKNITKRNG